MPNINLLFTDVNIRIWRDITGIIETNTYIIADSFNNCFLIDSAFYFPDESEFFIKFIEKNKLIPEFIINTHGHFDHISGVDALRDYFGIPLLISERDADMITDSDLNRSAMLSLDIKCRKADITLSGEETVFAGEFDIKIIETPGHTNGSISLLLNGRYLFSGDTLFKESIGRCFSFEDLEEEKKSIRKKLFMLKDNTIVLPGHGETTTIGNEKTKNKFL